MPEPLRKRTQLPADVNQWARHVVDVTTTEPEASTPAAFKMQLKEYMRTIGAKGGKIGGKRRMASMAEADKSALGLKAATARWSKERAKKKRGTK